MNMFSKSLNAVIAFFEGDTTVQFTQPRATIVNQGDTFALVERGTGTTIATYARARDAKRGATRRGFFVA